MDVFWSVRGRVVDTRKVILARVDVGEHPLAPKEPSWSRSPTRMGRRTAIDGGLALTFGTLLSSQGAGAHRFGSFDPSRGNSLTLGRRPEAVKAVPPATRPSRVAGRPGVEPG